MQGAYGAWDLSVYESKELSRSEVYSGEFFHVAFLMLNLVIILNLIIAIITEEYANTINFKDGLFCNELLNNFAALEWDDHWGFLTVAIPPFNVFIPFVMPFALYAESQGKDKLKAFNNKVCKWYYAPFSIVFGIIFFVINIICSPFAYILILKNIFTSLFYQR